MQHRSSNTSGSATSSPATSGSTRRLRRAALTGVAAVALSCTLLTGTAFAKSGAYVQANRHTVRIGQSVQVTASGGDDSVRFTYACLDERTGSGNWVSLGCASRPWASYSRTVRAGSFGWLQFRARLLSRNYPGGRLRVDRLSNGVSVLVLR